MTLQTKLIILGFLILATTLEVTGDAIIRLGLGRSVFAVKGAYFAAGERCCYSAMVSVLTWRQSSFTA